MLIQPHLLRASAKRQPTTVFLCGPGQTAGNFGVRESVRKGLESVNNVSVTYGEEIEEIPDFKHLGTDLQTLEYGFAFAADFTILIIDSPGAIAELGAFSMIPNIRRRLVALVPSQFYDSNSYIARGPLSLLARNDTSSVIYYDANKIDSISKHVCGITTMYKFFAATLMHSYYSSLKTMHKSSSYYYEKMTDNTRSMYHVSATLTTILALERPTFIDIISKTSMPATIIRSALKALFEAKSIAKYPNGTYRAIRGFSDPLLGHFSGHEISRLRTQLSATN